MRITSIIYPTAVTILIKINTLVCTIAEVYDLPNLASDTLSSTNPEITTNDSEIHPLPWKTFTKEVSDLLSPDIFSQADPLAYLSVKVKNLPRDLRQKINHNIITPLWRKTFPKQYTPYAELASSLLACLSQLESAKEMIQIIQNASKSNNPFKPLNMSIFELGLTSSLFSPYIFSDSYPPLRLLGKLLAIPEVDVSNATIQLQNLLKNRLFPRRYFGYVKGLLAFFNHEYLLRNLKSNIAKIQPNQHDVSSVWKVNEFDLESHDQPVPKSNLSSEQDSSLVSKVVDSSHNDHQVVHHSQQKYFSNYVVNFLSPDMFSQSDPFTYFLQKATKMNRDLIRDTSNNLSNSLDSDEFPPHYIPYAQLASTLLSCLEELSNFDINNDIRDIRWSQKINYYSPLKFDVSKLDPKLSELFSPEIMATAANPSIPLLETLIDIPENEISNVVIRLKHIEKNYRFLQLYRSYNTHLWKFIDRKQYLILRLKDDIAEIQRILMLKSTAPSSQQISFIKGSKCLLRGCSMP